MKIRHTSLVAASVVAFTFGSCTLHDGEAVSRNKLYANATDVDSEGFTFLKTGHEKAVLETELAKYVQSSAASAQAKALAGRVIETYREIIPGLQELATGLYVVLPDPGMPAFQVPHHFAADSIAGFDSEAYIAHVQHEQALMLEQFKRASRNTVKPVQHFAHEQLPAVKTLYADAGGQEDHGAHH